MIPFEFLSEQSTLGLLIPHLQRGVENRLQRPRAGLWPGFAGTDGGGGRAEAGMRAPCWQWWWQGWVPPRGPAPGVGGVGPASGWGSVPVCGPSPVLVFPGREELCLRALAASALLRPLCCVPAQALAGCSRPWCGRDGLWRGSAAGRPQSHAFLLLSTSWDARGVPRCREDPGSTTPHWGPRIMHLRGPRF